MSGVVVRLERSEDRPESLEVERHAFGSAEEAAIVEAVRDEEGSFALVAVEDRTVVGHVQLSRAWIGADAVLALGPIGVRPDRQSEGIGSRLVTASLDEARRRGEPAVILLGNPRYYSRFGFRPAIDRGLRNPFAGVREGGFVVEEEDFMLADVGEESRAFAGTVRWHPAYGQPG